MDNTLIQYYTKELEYVGGAGKIKISSEFSETKWMNITPELAKCLIEKLQNDFKYYL